MLLERSHDQSCVIDAPQVHERGRTQHAELCDAGSAGDGIDYGECTDPGVTRCGRIADALLGIAENIVPTAPWVGDQWIGFTWTDVVAFVILILILVFRPTGILGERLGRAA